MEYRDIKILLRSDSLYCKVLKLSLEVKRFKKTIRAIFMGKKNEFFCSKDLFGSKKCDKQCNDCIGCYVEQFVTKNDALEFIKKNHNGEIPYTFGKNEYSTWMAKYANHVLYMFLKSKKFENISYVKFDEYCPNCKGLNIVDTDDNWTKCIDCDYTFLN